MNKMTSEPESNDTPQQSWVRLARFVLPFLLFIVVTSLEPEASSISAFGRFYLFKMLAVVGALVWAWGVFPKWNWNGIPLAILAGAVGAVVWIGLTKLDVEAPLRDMLPASLVGGERAAWNPWESDDLAQPWVISIIVLRLAGLAIIVPLMEELFWRGFLIRYLIDADFESVPYGKCTVVSFVLVTVAFVLVHPEWTAALVWGTAVNGVYVLTKNLWACIVMHAVTNALLGAWILTQSDWVLW